MTRKSHDHNFKNLFADFPKEALEWILPKATEKFGLIQKIEFLRQEPKKHRLSDTHLALDMPILFSFEKGQLLLWLVEFQEDKHKFSICKLLKYVADSTEAYPKATVIPTVLFTDRRKWRKDVMRQLNTEFDGRTFLHFEYVLIRLFDLNARDFYHVRNPLIKILLPKMNYEPEERAEVIRQALLGLHRLVSPMLFDKYSDFIDIYAEVQDDERDSIQQELEEEKEAGMILRQMKEKAAQEGHQEGLQQGLQQGVQKGVQQGFYESLIVLLKAKFGDKQLKSLQSKIAKIADAEKLKALIEVAARAASPQEVLNFIKAEK